MLGSEIRLSPLSQTLKLGRSERQVEKLLPPMLLLLLLALLMLLALSLELLPVARAQSSIGIILLPALVLLPLLMVSLGLSSLIAQMRSGEDTTNGPL